MSTCEELLRRVADLEAEVGRLRTENEQLKALVEELRRAGKRQAAPFSKGPPKCNPKSTRPQGG